MIQTVALMLLIAAEAALVYYNIPAMDSTVTIAGPGIQITVSLLAVMAAVAGAFGLIWLAGLADRAGFERQARQRDATLGAIGEEMMRMKSSAYDRERPPLADIRLRLETMERDLRGIRLRLGVSPQSGGDGEQTHVAAGDRRG